MKSIKILSVLLSSWGLYIFLYTQQVSGGWKNDSDELKEEGVLYGIDDLKKEEIEASSRSNITVFGEDVGLIEQAFLSDTPSCDTKDILLTKMDGSENRALYLPQIPNHMVGEKNLFFCTEPRSYEINSMVKVRAAQDKKWVPILIVFFILLLTMSATFSGLNLAIMSFSINDLMLIEEYDNSQVNRKRASNILMVRRHTNFVLCSIITGNVLCNTLITLTLDYFSDVMDFGGVWVEFTSTAFQLVFTEILPALFFTKNALYIASKMHYLVIFFMVLTCPLTYPISKILDMVIGRDDPTKEKMDAEMLVGLQGQTATSKDFNEVVTLVRNTLKLRRKQASDIMTPIEKVFMISDQQVITSNFMNAIVSRGHTRLPVCVGDDVHTIRGVLNVKDLVLMLADDASASKLTAATLLSVLGKSRMYRYVLATTPVPQLMNELEKGCPMAIVVEFAAKGRNSKAIKTSTMGYKVVGIVTLEDNLEEVVGEILDEKDIQAPAAAQPTMPKLYDRNETTKPQKSPNHKSTL